MKKRKKRVWIWIVLAIVIALAVAGWFWMKKLGEQITQVNYKTVVADVGSVTRSITGSGRLEAESTATVDAEDMLTYAEVYAERGAMVRAGDVLAVYDADSIRDRIDALYAEIATLDSNLSYRTTSEAITSPSAGRVKEIYAAAGDDLESVMQQHGALLLLSADEKMQIIFPSEETEALSIGKTVTVVYENTNVKGTVANKTADGYLVTIPDNNVPLHAFAEVYDGNTKMGEGTLEIHLPVYVYGANGTVESVNVSVNATVRAGAKLFTLADKPVSSTYANTLSSREEKAEKIQALYQLLVNPVITAPRDGVVAEVSAMKSGVAGKRAFVLHTGGATKMTIAVDELDIGIVSVGQEAVVTMDAFAGESFPATVSNVSFLGTPSGSITTYSVELTIDADERLLEGMNGSAIIVAQRKDDVLLIPVEAIYEDESGVYVYVQGEEESVRRDIVTGLSDGSVAEVISGLSKGETVQYHATYVSLIEQYRQMSTMARGGN
ncbi:MAG: HlyD family efflux transporter periplasmic adaptor subunit [Clostridia bacterium]|nr:HlyD family efflux transporter periplasmic adaptor subunit [Clostridia bacterium]